MKKPLKRKIRANRAYRRQLKQSKTNTIENAVENNLNKLNKSVYKFI